MAGSKIVVEMLMSVLKLCVQAKRPRSTDKSYALPDAILTRQRGRDAFRCRITQCCDAKTFGWGKTY
jgi:hypothetical protein